MACKPDTPCSVCGTLMWSSKTSRPADTRVCHPCRRRQKVAVSIKCPTCENWLSSLGRDGKPRAFCSKSCASRARPCVTWLKRPGGSRPCADCGEAVACKAGTGVVLCRPCAKVRRIESWRRRNHRRRMLIRGAISEPYTVAEIAERDGYRCQLCRLKVDMRLKVPHLKAPTIDHVIPLTEGGDDTRANVQLAHFQCNSRKGARGHQQLALVG